MDFKNLANTDSLKNVFSKKKRTEDKISRGDVVFNEDNVVRIKEFKSKEPGVIEISTAARVVNVITAIVSIAALLGISFLAWWILSEVGFVDSLNESVDFESIKTNITGDVEAVDITSEEYPAEDIAQPTASE